MLQAYTLFSGSQGNCIYIKSEDTEILIDAGRSCSAIQKALSCLGTSLENIRGIFITHEHSDHINGLEVICKKFKTPVYLTKPSYDGCVRADSHLFGCAVAMDVEYEINIGSILLRSFPVPHDSAQNIGFVVTCGGESLGVATDIGHLTETIARSLSSCKKIIIEANHDEKMLENGPYPRFLKDRILSPRGHLSNTVCARFVCYLCERGACEFTLAHLSRENNTPKTAYERVRSEMELCGFDDIPLKVALADATVNATDGKSYKVTE
ncbi:MAG: MBL fold metallo-hydrolase [Clostridia bacterium]|nr:MBL fold metallo-hydrolase [Clostridia bacterium]